MVSERNKLDSALWLCLSRIICKLLQLCLSRIISKLTIVNNFRYHVPKSWLNPTGNLLVVFEEWGGDPNGIFLVRRDIDSACADIYEWQPTLMNWKMQSSGKANKPLPPKAHLSCGPGQKISWIKFASFGTPQGACGSFREGSCHAHKSYDAFQRVCYAPA